VTSQRSLAMGRLVLIDLISQVVSVAVMIGWALVERSVWALVAGGLASMATKAALSHLMLAGAGSGFAVDRASLAELLHFGRWILLSTVVTFLALQIDRLVLGVLVPIGMVGVYS